MGATNAYRVIATRRDDLSAGLTARGQEPTANTANIAEGSAEAGFSAAGTLLAAVDVRLANARAIGCKVQLDVRCGRVGLDAVWREELRPHTGIGRQRIVERPEPAQKQQEPDHLCLERNTVQDMLSKG